jgi:hypothetical protein
MSCLKEFPHLVEMHQKYAKDGFVAISVTVDTPADAGKALAFLQKQKAEFANFLLDETDKVWQEKLKIEGPPCIYVFNKDNRIVKKMGGEDNDVTNYEVVEKIVVQLLKK